MQINELMEAIKRNNHEAFTKLYDLTYLKVKNLIFKIVKSLDKTEDIVQETFLTVWIKRGTFTPMINDDERWITVIARNYAYKAHNCAKKERILTKSLEDCSDFADVDSMLDTLIDNSNEIMQMLSEDEGTVILMRAFEFTPKEIMEKTGLNRDRINYLIRTAKKKLFDYYEQNEKAK